MLGEPKDGQPAAQSAAAPATNGDAPPAAAEAADSASGLSLVETVQEKTANALDSLQKAVAPTPETKSADPEVNEFRDLVGEVFSNMKESIAADKQDKEGTSAAAAAQGKAVASSPAEPQQGVFAQVKAAGALLAEKIIPVAHAAPRGEPPVGEGKSKGLLEDLGENVEEAVEAVVHPHHDARHPRGRAGHREADDKWGRAKEEAREGGREFNAAARDAADAVGDKSRYAADRAADKTAGFFQGPKDTVRDAAEETEDLSRSAADRVRRDWPGREVRGVVDETKDLTNSAAGRVKEDWQDVKRGARRTLDESSAARDWEAKHAPKKEERGWFSSLFGGNGDADAGDKAREAADRARSKAEEGKEKTKGWFNDTSDEARRTADDAKDRSHRFFNSASDDARRSADKAEAKTRGFFNRAADEADRAGDKAANKLNRFGERVSDTAEDAKHTVQDKINRAEDYLTADLRPRDDVDKLLSQGFVPSNTWEVLHSRYYREE